MFDNIGVKTGNTRSRDSNASSGSVGLPTCRLYSLKHPAAEVTASSWQSPHSSVTGQEKLLLTPVRKVPGAALSLDPVPIPSGSETLVASG